MDIPQQFLSLAEAAARLQLSSVDVIALIAAGDLRGMRVGTPPEWQVEEASITGLIQQLDSDELIATWNAANAVDLPELRRPTTLGL